MPGYDFERLYVLAEQLTEYRAIDRGAAQRYGATAKAIDMTNTEYRLRFNRLNGKQRMRSPPSTGPHFSRLPSDPPPRFPR